MNHEQLGAAIAGASTLAQCDQLAGTLWRAYAAGQIPDNQAQALGEAIEIAEIEAERAQERAMREEAQDQDREQVASPSYSSGCLGEGGGWSLSC